MARAYSMDLRERAIARLDAGESVRAVAAALDNVQGLSHICRARRLLSG